MENIKNNTNKDVEEAKYMELQNKDERLKDWREKCCYQCKYHLIKYEGVEAQCDFSKCSDEEVLNFTTSHGCQGVRKYLETGDFPKP